MTTDTSVAAPAGSLLGRVEGAAWRIPLSSRRLFLALAISVAALLTVSALAAAWVAARNADTIEGAREQGLDVAAAATDFRTALAAADAEAATTLLAGGLETDESRRTYDDNIDQASQALTRLGHVVTDDDADDVEEMGLRLVDYTRLVDTARANSRQGFPVGAAYLQQARGVADSQLVPLAERVRSLGERRVARAANDVTGPVGAIAGAVVALGLVALMLGSLLVAGRTRRAVHPALLAAGLAATVTLVLVGAGIWNQGRELRSASTDEFVAYRAANATAATLSDMRVTEIAAVASRGSGGPLYDTFEEEGAGLLTDLGEGEGGAGREDELRTAVDAYIAAVGTVRQTDEGGNNAGAADSVVAGESATAFDAVDELAATEAAGAASSLADRFDAAGAADVPPYLPLLLGGAAAALAAAGTLARGRRYR